MKRSNETPPNDEQLGKLIAAAGPGESADPEARRRVYQAVRARWEAEVGAQTAATLHGAQGRDRSRRSFVQRRTRLIGIAATVSLCALTLVWLQNRQPRLSAPVEFAQVARLEGSAELLRDGQLRRLASVETTETIQTGDRLTTGDNGRLSLSLGGDFELRVNVATDLVFSGPGEIDLLAGTVYVDNAGLNRPLQISTPLGAVEHLGTQYEVRFDAAALRVRIREGSVRVSDSPGDSGDSGDASDAGEGIGAVVGVAGEQLDIGSGGAVARSVIASDDLAWRWAEQLATLAPADEYAVLATLAWIARERGLQLEFENPNGERRLADSAPVFGLDGLSPDEVLEVIGRTTDLRFAVREDRLVVLD